MIAKYGLLSKTTNRDELVMTKAALSEDIDDRRLAPRGFDLDNKDMIREDCVLIMGINPAGNLRDAEREKEDRIYFYSLPDYCKQDSDDRWLHNKYFRPLHTFVESVVGCEAGVKWPWCNLSLDVIKTEIKKYVDLKPYSESLIKYYEKHSENKYTIFIGDMFYYHETKQNELPLKSDYDYVEHCHLMLEWHINALLKHNKKIAFVYVNNAKVSNWLRPDKEDDRTIITVKDVPVFLGGMLSGQRAMDSFSRSRLVNEIKRTIELSNFNGDDNCGNKAYTLACNKENSYYEQY